MSLLLRSVASFAGDLSDAQEAALTTYCALVRETGKRWNIMSQSALAVVEEHVVDSAALLSVYDAGSAAVADLGSGAGLPGIVLAILRPHWRVSLVDSRRSKAVFLREVLRTLELENATVVHDRVESLAGADVDLAVSRALSSIEDSLVACLSVARPGGMLVLYKGPLWFEERARAVALAESVGARLLSEKRVPLAGLGRETLLVSFSGARAVTS